MYIHLHHSHESMYAVVTPFFFPFFFTFETNGKCKLFEENNRRKKERFFLKKEVKKRDWEHRFIYYLAYILLYIVYVADTQLLFLL